MQMYRKDDAHEANSVADVVNLLVSREKIIYLVSMKRQNIKRSIWTGFKIANGEMPKKILRQESHITVLIYLSHNKKILRQESNISVGIYLSHNKIILRQESHITVGIYLSHSKKILRQESHITVGVYLSHNKKILRQESHITVDSLNQ